MNTTSTQTLVKYNRYTPKSAKRAKRPVGDLRGCVVAIKDKETGRVALGWSLCNPKDRFNKERALQIAVGRATNGSNLPVPACLENDFEQIADRGERYFKAALAV